ncbi:glycosyltransferase family 9 protein [Uliginosibacterium sp. H3]|uniref:Glycosyltransferase family 9 protein n=1 Tax=Uliginosibacterium silvisoli TaxID=3114758 RepID=A0ABU6K6R3_9RHOO|nr:glycosyltransferase family 9 protein [Uliginosibacterium sp. H3]
MKTNYIFDLFTYHPDLFKACPYVDNAYPMADESYLHNYPFKITYLFDLKKLPHWDTDTFDFISIPAGIPQLSFKEKQLEYFPQEEDKAGEFDVVLNTSRTWPSRSWAPENWQRLADTLTAKGLRVAVVGKDVVSKADHMEKLCFALKGCTNLINKLSLDQTFFTIRKSKVFVSCQNGLSVLAGATDTRIVVLDMSIEWSKRAIYRYENPHHKISYVKGKCDLYCGEANACPLPHNNGSFKCIPEYERVAAAVSDALAAA